MNWPIEFLYYLLFTGLTGSLFWLLWKLLSVVSIYSSSLLTITYRLIPLGILFFLIPFGYLLLIAEPVINMLHGQYTSILPDFSKAQKQAGTVFFFIWASGFLISISI